MRGLYPGRVRYDGSKRSARAELRMLDRLTEAGGLDKGQRTWASRRRAILLRRIQGRDPLYATGVGGECKYGAPKHRAVELITRKIINQLMDELERRTADAKHGRQGQRQRQRQRQRQQ